ncbi:MAG: InlB B-repeat-containing protein [Prevotella sp.]|nr:InlB B-repeat-containing protein [Prevotella sp.]
MKQSFFRKAKGLIMLSILALTAQTAWADNLTSANLLIDSEITEGTAGHYYYTMPRVCNNTLTITEQDISDGKGTFNVYDCGGKNHDQDWYNLNEALVITAPLGYEVKITGTAKTDDNQYQGSEYLSVYDGTSTSGAYLGRFGTTSHSEYYNVDVQSSSNSIMLEFVTSMWNIKGRGLNLTVSLVEVQHSISFATINIEKYHRYTGSAVDLGYTVDDSKGNRLTQGTHYNATIKNNNGEVVQSAISEGHYTLTIEGISPYSGTKTVDFWVNENPGVLIDSDIAEGTLGHFFSLMPKSGSATVDLTQSDVATLMIYDDGGKGGGYDSNTPGNFTPKANGYLLLHAPAGFQIHLTGHVRTKSANAYLTVHNGNTDSAPTLCANVHGVNSSAGTSTYKDVTVDVISTGEYMLLHFDAGALAWGWDSEGLILTASIGHSITVADGITHGSVSCDNFWIKSSSTTIPLTVTPDVGYSVNTVSYNDGSNHTLTPDVNGAYSFTMPDKAVSVSATFTPTVYSISYELAGGTLATTNPDNYTIESENITLINPTRTDYEFSGWTGTGLDAASTNVTIVQGTTGNRSYTATWTPISYSISYNGVEGATNPNPADYTIESEAITLDAPTKDGYTFVGWYDNSEFTGSAVTTITAGSTGDKTFWAKWIQDLTYGGVTIKDNGTTKSASLDASQESTISITSDVVVNTVELNRDFTANQPATVMLPFSLGDGQTVSGGSFYKFSGVTKDGDVWKALFTEVATLKANTPYLFMPSATGQMNFNLNGGTVTLNTTTAGEAGSTASNWEFCGTYAKVQWDGSASDPSDLSKTYGFAKGNATIAAGQFVHFAAGAWLKPMRCYLVYNGSTEGGTFQNAPSRTRGAGSTEELPQTITVVLLSSSGETTAIGTLDTKTGDITLDGWYTMDGRKLEGKPTKKGLYINNGRKIVIK